MLAEILLLREIFLGRFFRNEIPGPDLAMRMGIGATHRSTLVLEELNPAITASEIGGLILPGSNDIADLLRGHLGQ